MTNWEKKTFSELRKNGFEPHSVEETERGRNNKVLRARCSSKDLAIKWFNSSKTSSVPSIGKDINTFIGGWYVHQRLLEMTDVPTPKIEMANFLGNECYYVMENVDFAYSDNLWSNDMYLFRMCQEMGSIFSNIHTVTESSLGGIPGKKNDVMVNMRRYIKNVENMIKNTPYNTYRQKVKNLKKRYERIFNPKSRRLIHGDPTASNILTDTDGVIIGLVDWEDSMYADPLLDVAIFEAMVCDVFGVFSPWDIKTLRQSIEESYIHGVNEERLNILRSLVHIKSASFIKSESMLSPWNRVASQSQVTRQELHRNRFKQIIETMNL